MKKENLSADEIDKVLNKESGVYGVSGISVDFRDIETAEKEGNERAKLALDNYNYLANKLETTEKIDTEKLFLYFIQLGKSMYSGNH